MVKIWGWNSNRKRSNRQRKNGTCERLWRQWCHLAFMHGHVSDSKCSWSVGINSYARSNSRHSAASNSWCLAPVTLYWPRHYHPRFFGHFRLYVWPCFCLNFDLELSPSNSTNKSLQDQRFWFWTAVCDQDLFAPSKSWCLASLTSHWPHLCHRRECWAIRLTMFLFEFWPQTFEFTIELFRKKSFKIGDNCYGVHLP